MNFQKETNRFEALHGGHVEEGDGGEVQDEAVDGHSGHTDVARELGVPVHLHRQVGVVRGQVQILHFAVAIRLLSGGGTSGQNSSLSVK